MVEHRFRGAVELFREQAERGAMSGGVLVVHCRGETVVAEAVGIARGLRPEEGVSPEAVRLATPFQVMSVSKAVVAFIFAMLEDQGLVDVAAPVARVFPAFAARGKEAITVEDVLTHRSGVLLDDLVRRPELWADDAAVAETIAAAQPDHPRGTLAYEAYAFGWILGEVVRRATGRSLPEYLAEVLPPELQPLRFRAPADMRASVARNYWMGRPGFRLGGVPLAESFERVNNGIACFEALVPGAGMVTDAETLALFYDMLLAGGVCASGRRLVRAEVLARYITLQQAGRDRITGAWMRLGRGFALGWPLPHPYGAWGSSRCYGHPGGFGHVAFADPDTRAAIVMLTTASRGVVDLVRRFAPLSRRIRRAAALTASGRGSP
jgi:CubicO group peptidase (beta-lactamase class C family)